MIPLSLRLVLKTVHPAGEWKEIYVLNLSAPYSLIEMQARARIPPGRVLWVCSPPDLSQPSTYRLGGTFGAIIRSGMLRDSPQERQLMHRVGHIL